MRILVINDRLPFPADGGAELRLSNLLNRISQDNEVWFVGFLDRPEETARHPQVERSSIHFELIRLPRRPKITYLGKVLRFLLSNKPIELVFYDSLDLRRAIRHLVETMEFDAIEIVQSHMAPYLEVIPKDLWPRCVLTFVDVEHTKFGRIFSIENRPGKKMRAWLRSRMMRQWEPTYAERFGRCVAMSDADKDLLVAANPRLEIDVVPNGVDTKVLVPLPETQSQMSLLFVGSMDYSPCVDAMVYFCREVLPIIRRELPQVELWIVGRNPRPEVRVLAGPDVHVTGRVDDVIPYYEQSTACVVPLRAGGGTRLKILEAMALARPVVSTSVGCEGLKVVHSEHLLIADGKDEFARLTIGLLQNRILRKRIATNARALVEELYDWDAISRALLRTYSRLGTCTDRSLS